MPTLRVTVSEQVYTALNQTAQERRQSVELLVQDALDSFLQLPAAGDASDAENLESPVAERWAKIRSEARAWRALPAETRRRYGADFVAVHNGQVVDHDSDRLALHQRIRRRFGDIPILITPAQAPTPREFAVDPTDAIEARLDVLFDEATDEDIDAILDKHLNSPDPEPDQMIRFGMFKGRIPVDEEYFRMAEWHPSAEDLAGV